MIRTLAALILLSVPAAATAQPAAVRPQDVISTLTADWNDDGGMDRAVLVGDGEEVDLIVYMSKDHVMEAVAFAPGLVWAGQSWGQTPSLQLSPSGGLQVVSRNDSIGRWRWEETLTLAWRDNQMVVAGVTTVGRDTIDTEAGGSCDINLLTGTGTVLGKPVKVPAGGVPVAKWSRDKVPEGC